MQFKRYVADDFKEALAAVKAELGPDAMVVATRTVEGGLLSRPRVEVTAALEQTPVEKSADKTDDARKAVPTDTTLLDRKLQPLRRELAALRDAVGRDDEDLRRMLTEYSDDLQRILTLLAASQAKGGSIFESLLLAADVESLFARQIAVRAEAHGGIAEEALERALITEIRTLPQTDHGRQILALVGPTGVGKTTTIAKLAAHSALIRKRRTALITLDTYRIGAIDHLAQYADLMRVPMEVCRDASGLQQAIDRHPDAEMIFIDTAGRGPNDTAQISQLRHVFAELNVDVHLALAAATRQLEMRRIHERYRSLPVKAAIITKMDEAAALGGIINLSMAARLPLSHVTFGQRVPEDIAQADAKRLAKLIVDLATRGAAAIDSPDRWTHTAPNTPSHQEVQS